MTMLFPQRIAPRALHFLQMFLADHLPKNTKWAVRPISFRAAGLRFIYFEKVLIEVDEDDAEVPVATCSVVSIARSSGKNFESGLAIDKDLPFYRENDGICFWWNDAGPESKAIPVKKLDHWLTDIASTFKTETSRPTLAHERA